MTNETAAERLERLRSLARSRVSKLVAGEDVTAHSAPSFDDGLEAYKRGDYAAAMLAWRPLADTGDAKAQHAVADLYYCGQGVQRDYAEAAKWFMKAADQEHVAALYMVGIMCLHGKGPPMDVPDGLGFIGRAANNGYSQATYFLEALKGERHAVKEANAVLWKNVYEGMSLSEVKSACEESILAPSDAGTYSNGAKTLLHIPAYRVADTNLIVEFIFGENFLERVRLSHPNSSAPVEEFIEICKKIDLALVTKYGDPIKRDIDNDGADSIDVSVEWESEATVISLNYHYFGEAIPSLFSLSYESRMAAIKRKVMNFVETEELEKSNREKVAQAIARDADLL